MSAQYLLLNSSRFFRQAPSQHMYWKLQLSVKIKSFTHMFLFLFLSSLSMMKRCVLGGSTIKLGIVLLSPLSRALGPGHAVAERHLGGFPLQCSFLYQGFLLTVWGWWDTSEAQTKEEAPLPSLPLLLLLPHS